MDGFMDRLNDMLQRYRNAGGSEPAVLMVAPGYLDGLHFAAGLRVVQDAHVEPGRAYILSEENHAAAEARGRPGTCGHCGASLASVDEMSTAHEKGQ